MLKIVADDKIPFLKGVLEQWAEVKYLPGSRITRESIVDADALLIRTRTKCTESLLENTNIRFIGTATIGFDHIDTGYCDSHDIFWTNAPGCNSSSVQQYITAALSRFSAFHKMSLKDKTLGIVGVGNVGTKVEKVARSLGMNVLLNDPPRARVEGPGNFTGLKRLLAESDIITVHVPLNLSGEDFTYHLFEDENFLMMKKGAWFINSSRGEVVNTADLKHALSTGRLAGAVIDVWENEPEIDHDLLELAFLATPHIAGYSADGKANGTAMVVNSLSSFFELPLSQWYPSDIPVPGETSFNINCLGKSVDEVINEAVSHCYDITEDDRKLRYSPADFEKLRGNYRVRREFPAFSLTLKNEHGNIRKLLGDIGFKFKP